MFPYINLLHDILKDRDPFPLIRMPLVRDPAVEADGFGSALQGGLRIHARRMLHGMDVRGATGSVERGWGVEPAHG